MNALGPFLAARTDPSIVATHGHGSALTRYLSRLMDDALAHLATGIGDAAVVAIGGYGKRRLCLASDVDVMLLVTEEAPEEALTRSIFYPLWDAKIDVGHSVRTPTDVVDAAAENFETLCSLLTARLVAGDEGLFDEMTDRFRRLLRRTSVSDALASEERSRRLAEPYRLLAMDVKRGRGGLRSVDGVDWDLHTRALLADDRPSGSEPSDDEEILIEVRNALHAIAGKPMEIYAPDVRDQVARRLGTDVRSLGRRLYGAARQVERRAAEHWPDLHDVRSTDPVSVTGRWILRALRSLRADRSPDVDRSPVLDLAVQMVADPHRHLDETERGSITDAAAPEWTEADRRAIVRILAGGRRGREVWDALHDLGWLGRAFPEWDHVVAAPQISPVHLHPIDDHLWRAVDELVAIAGGTEDEPWVFDVADDLGSIDDALVAALFHDIGKGLEGDHSEVGAVMVREIATRMGFEPWRVDRFERLVRHHLVLSEASTRRDTGDPEVMGALARAVGHDLDTLRMLYLISVADARATGPTVWTPWQATLMHTAFVRAKEAIEGDPRWADDIDAVGQRVSDVSGMDPALVVGHLEGLSRSYRHRYDPEEIGRHLELVTPPPTAGEVRIAVEPGDPATGIVVATVDRPGVLAVVSGVLALHNITVLDARVATRGDGVAIDSFAVEDALGGGVIPDHRLDDVRDVLPRYLAGARDLESALAVKATTYRRPASPMTVPSVRIHRSEGAAVIEVRCSDRVGLLHDLSRVLFERGLDVDLARVDTRATRVVDVFHVVTPPGDEWLDGLERALVEAAS